MNKNSILWLVIYNLSITKSLDQELWKSCSSWQVRKFLNHLTNTTFLLRTKGEKKEQNLQFLGLDLRITEQAVTSLCNENQGAGDRGLV